MRGIEGPEYMRRSDFFRTVEHNQKRVLIHPPAVTNEGGPTKSRSNKVTPDDSTNPASKDDRVHYLKATTTDRVTVRISSSINQEHKADSCSAQTTFFSVMPIVIDSAQTRNDAFSMLWERVCVQA